MTPEITAVIIDRVSGGVPQKYAAIAAGVTDRCIRHWLKKGELAEEGTAEKAFFSAYQKAFANCVARNVGIIQKAASERDEVTEKTTTFPDGTVKSETTTKKVIDWPAAAWWLERTCHKEFVRRTAATIETTEAPKTGNRIVVEKGPDVVEPPVVVEAP